MCLQTLYHSLKLRFTLYIRLTHQCKHQTVMKGSSTCIYTFLASVLTLIIVANAIVVLYACLLWDDYEEINAKFVVGIIIFIGCTTLPFALITGYLVRNRFIYLDKCCKCNWLFIFLYLLRCIRHLRRVDAFSSLNYLIKDGKYRM